MRLLLQYKTELREIEEKLKAASGIPRDGSGKPDYSDDFFGRNAFLAVSGQLNAEAYACALTDVYTFGEPSSLSFCKEACQPLQFLGYVRLNLHARNTV